MKIQFIIVGWYYNQKSLLEILKDVEDVNEFIDVFYVCHKEPIDFVKNNFHWKLFDNVGEEIVAYQQAIEYLNLEDDTMCIFMNDDIVVKDWKFIEECAKKITQGYKVVGNGYNKGFNAYDPFLDIPIGITEEFDDKRNVDYVKPENLHYFEGRLEMNMARGSFLVMQYSTIKKVGGFEPRKEAWVPIHVNQNGKPYYRGYEHLADTKTLGMSLFGNLFPNLTMYKINKEFGKESITWLSDTYRNSEYLYEYERGEES